MFKNVSIKVRMMILSAFLNGMLLLMAFFAYVGTEKLVQDNDKVYFGGVQDMLILHRMHGIIYQDIMGSLRAVRIGAQSSAQSENLIQEAFKNLTASFDTYFNQLEPTFKQAAKELQNLIHQSQDETMRALHFFHTLPPHEAADSIQKAAYPLFNQMGYAIDQLISMHYEDTSQEYRQAAVDAQSIRLWFDILAFVGCLAAIIFTCLIIKNISKPLAEAVMAVDQLSIGDTSMQLVDVGQNEAGQVIQAVQQMIAATKKIGAAIVNIAQGDLAVEVPVRSDKDLVAKALNHMIVNMKKTGTALVCMAKGDLRIEVPIRSEKDTLGKALNHMIFSMKKMLSKIQAEVNALTTSSQEIATSINQVSTGTSESMAAVTETTATVEELKQTAHISAEKAKNVLACAEETLNVIKSGENTLHLTASEMNQIEEKMRTISQSIVKLSEHSAAISEIINTVNSLAEQSNLLAVNAAIEAAKAGDQGKSFSVVAQEIRSLAEQSKAATVQVRAILSDIQNATSAAILATEQGSKAVAKGVLQSAEMSQAIHALNASISRVSIAANQISISSQQQLVGVDQVTVAMANISEATNQHVEQMRQIELAANSLNEIALNLKELVNLYKTNAKTNHNFHNEDLDDSETIVENRKQDFDANLFL